MGARMHARSHGVGCRGCGDRAAEDRSRRAGSTGVVARACTELPVRWAAGMEPRKVGAALEARVWSVLHVRGCAACVVTTFVRVCSTQHKQRTVRGLAGSPRTLPRLGSLRAHCRQHAELKKTEGWRPMLRCCNSPLNKRTAPPHHHAHHTCRGVAVKTLGALALECNVHAYGLKSDCVVASRRATCCALYAPRNCNRRHRSPLPCCTGAGVSSLLSYVRVCKGSALPTITPIAHQ